MSPRKPIFDAVRRAQPAVWNTPGHVEAMDALLDTFKVPAEDISPFTTDVTTAICLELLEHEAIVQEMYFDSEDVPTWGVGVTSASGHSVQRYKDNPQSVERCLEIYVWLLRNRYLPPVLSAFKGMALTEAQLGAALSFNYNTGAIERASWVKLFKAGDRSGAYDAFMNYSKPRAIIARRKLERELFFEGRWHHDGKVVVYTVRKPSYRPDWGSAKLVDVRLPLETVLRRK